MGMSRHDAYYEPEDDPTDTDELQHEVAELMKDDEFNPNKWDNFCEAFAALVLVAFVFSMACSSFNSAINCAAAA